MGGTSSKQNAFVGNNNNGTPSTKEPSCSCLTPFFCPPNKDTKSSHHRPTKSFGTPLPDTPENVRRLRGEHDYTSSNNTAGGYDDYEGNDEKKLSSSKDELRSSKYGGLEKELSGMFLYEPKSAVNGNDSGGDAEEKYAEIHDGKVSV